MRLSIAALLLLLAGAAQAQTPLTGTTGPIGSPTAPAVAPAPGEPPPADPARRRGHSLQEQFDAANVTHDGHLTQEQARSRMPSVARDFADIDTTHQGYVTVDQVREHRRAMRAARKAAAAKP